VLVVSAPRGIPERLRTALTGSPGTPLILLGSFEVENRWAEGEPGLPTVALAGSRAIVNRMDEFGLLLAGAGDHVVLKAPPDDGYLEYLSSLGLSLPRMLTVADQDPQRVITEDVLADTDLTAALAELAARNAQLWPHGVSDLEERLAKRCGLPLASAPAVICKTVNSKIYSRLAADATGLPQPPGVVCRDLDELAAACDRARQWLSAGRTVALKDAYGVSGKGILVIREERRLGQVQAMCARRARKRGNPRVGIVVEEWVPKQTDLNYQFTIDRDGAVHFDFVKEALTAGGVHQGHRMPARLTTGQVAELRQAAAALGSRLAADGYFGVVGVDALLTTAGLLYPVIEINARNNMSTYQEGLRQQFFAAGQTVLAKQFPVRLRRRVSFAELRHRLGEVLLRPGASYGLLVNNFATVNAAAPPGEQDPGARATFEGRLYGIIIAGSAGQASAIDRETTTRLDELTAAQEAPDE